MKNGPSSEHPAPANDAANGRLDSWKEIAAYLKRDVTTVQRWEKREGLPVHRHIHQSQASVYAYQHELDAWWEGHRNGLIQNGANGNVRNGRRILMLTAVAVAVAGVLLVSFWAWWEISLGSSPPALTVRKVFDGHHAYILSGPSPDGRYFGFIDPETMDLAIRDMETLKTHRVSRDGQGFWARPRPAMESVVFSWDGRQVAYGWLGRPWELRTSRVDGSATRTLLKDPEVASLRVKEWSRDGKWILLLLTRKNGENQIALVSTTDGKVNTVRTLGKVRVNQVSLSTDGKLVAFGWADPKTGKPDIHYVTADGTKEGVLVQHPAMDQQPTWTPDGRHVLFFSDRTGTLDAWLQRVEESSPVGEPFPVKRDMGNVMSMGFSRRGTFFYGNQVTTSDVLIAPLAMETNSGGPATTPINQTVQGATGAPDWSPDGKQLVYVTSKPPTPSGTKGFNVNQLALMLRDVASGKERELAEGGAAFGGPRWMPDGRSVVVASSENDKATIRQVDVRTGESTTLFTAADSNWIQSIDPARHGRKVYYRQGLRLQEYDLRTKQTREVLTPVYAHAISPDGKWLAVGNAQDLQLQPVQGGEPRKLLTLERPEQVMTLSWSPDGSLLYLGKGMTVPFVERTELWVVPLDGRAPWKQGIAAKGRMMDLHVHPDGKQVTYTQRDIIYEIWALENFLPRTPFFARLFQN